MFNIITCADYIINFLNRLGVETVFGLPGEGTMHFDAAMTSHKITYAKVVHEGLIGHAMHSYYRSSQGKIAAGIVTQSVGMEQAAIGLRNLFLDATPSIIILGDILVGQRYTENWKAYDALGLANKEAPLAKAIFRPDSTDQLVAMLPEVYKLLKSGRPGPIVLAIPSNVAASAIENPSLNLQEPKAELPDNEAVDKLFNAFTAKKFKKPVFIFGELMRHAGVRGQELAKVIAEKTGAICLTSWRNFDVYPESHQNYCGSFGIISPTHITNILNEADCVVTIGHWVDIHTSQGFKRGLFERKFLASIYNTDTAGNIGKVAEVNPFATYKPDLVIECDVLPFLEALHEKVLAANLTPNPQQQNCVSDNRQLQEEFYNAPATNDTSFIIRQLFDYLRENYPDYFILNDSGNNSVPFNNQRHEFATHGGALHGSMGYAAGSIGAAYGMRAAKRKGPVVSVMGDGTFNMYQGHMVQVVETWLRHNLSIHTIVLDNSKLATVETLAEKNGQQLAGNIYRSTNPDYAAMMEAGYDDNLIVGSVSVKQDFLDVAIQLIQNEHKKPSFMHCITR